MDAPRFDAKGSGSVGQDAVLLQMTGDPKEIPLPEPEKLPEPSPETIPEPDNEPVSPDEPEQIPPLPDPGQPSPEPNNPGQPMMVVIGLPSYPLEKALRKTARASRAEAQQRRPANENERRKHHG